MAHMLFHEAGLMETFQIPQREFINYFRALEANYGNNVCKLHKLLTIKAGFLRKILEVSWLSVVPKPWLLDKAIL